MAVEQNTRFEELIALITPIEMNMYLLLNTQSEDLLCHGVPEINDNTSILQT